MERRTRRKRLLKLFMEDIYATQEKRPNMIFSVIGDCENFVPRPWSKPRFQEALIYAAKAAGESWILTKGEPLKVSKTIREMMEEYVYLSSRSVNKKSAVRLISIPSRDVEDTSLYFDLPEAFEEDGTSSKSKVDGVFVDFFRGTWPEEKEYIEFRFEIERTLEKPTLKEKNALVIILVEGELSAVEHVKLAAENGIPVVVVKGTGGAADLLAKYLDLSEEEKKIQLRTLIPVLFGIKLEDYNMDELSESLQVIGKQHYLIKIFDLHEKTEEEFAAAVGEVIHIAWSLEDTRHWEDGDVGSREHTQKGDHTKTIRIRESTYMDREKWKHLTDPINMAENHEALSSVTFSSPFSLPLDLFTQYSKILTRRKYQSSVEDDEQKLLMIALIANRTDYVDVLLDSNISLSKDYINKLYQSQFQKSKNVNKESGGDVQQNENTTAKNDSEVPKSEDVTEKSGVGVHKSDNSTEKSSIGEESCTGIHWVLKESMKKELAADLCEGKDSHKNALKLCRNLLNYKGTEDPRLSANCNTKRRKEYVDRQIFLQAVLLWSLIANRTHIATLVWRRVANQLYTGLVSSLILRKMSSIAKLEDRKTAEKLKEHSKMFRKRVLNMMDTLYATDKEVSFEILDSLETVWKIQARPISFAHEFQMYDIMAHPCSIGLMNKLWYNGLLPNWKRFIFNHLKNQGCKALNAPCLHFVLHYILFGVAILLYSYFLMTNVKYFRDMAHFPRFCEAFLYSWTLFDFVNDVKNVLAGCVCENAIHVKIETRRKPLYRFLARLNDMWKFLGLVCLILAGLTILSRQSPTDDFLLITRFAGLFLIFSYLRYMRVLVLNRYTGTTFMFLKHMLLHLLQFCSMIIFFVLGVGIFYHAIQHQNCQDLFTGHFSSWHIWKIVYYPYYQFFGETFQEELGIDRDNKEVDWSVKAAMAIYMMVANVLIMNVSIAIFTTKYEEVVTKSEQLWHYERYHVIQDFQSRVFAHLNFLCFPIPMVSRLRKTFKENKPEEVQKKFKKIRHLQIVQHIMAGRSLKTV